MGRLTESKWSVFELNWAAWETGPCWRSVGLVEASLGSEAGRMR